MAETPVNSIDSLLSLAESEQAEGRFTAALQLYLKALEAGPDNIPAHLGAGLLYLNSLHDYGRAVVHLRAVVDARPKHLFALNNLGIALLKDGHPQDAIACFAAILKVHPNSQVHTNMAIALDSIRAHGEAVEHKLAAKRLLAGERNPGSGEYDPRRYWPARLESEGQLYVSTGNDRGVFDSQAEVFWSGLRQLLPSHAGRVLDFGCGVGRFAGKIAPMAASYTGADINSQAFEFAPRLPNATFVPLPTDALPFPDSSFDTVLIVTVLQHIVAPAQFEGWTSELRRVIRTGGAFFVIDDADTSSRLPKHMKVRGPDVIARALKAKVVTAALLSAERRNSHHIIHAIAAE